MVKGAVPGSKGGWVLIRDAVKRPRPEKAAATGCLPYVRRSRARTKPTPAGLQTELAGHRRRSAGRGVGPCSGMWSIWRARRSVRSTSPTAVFGAGGASRHPGARRQLAARQAARRHAQHQDAWRGRADRQEAVSPEGDRPRPAGVDEGAAHARRRHRLRSAAARSRDRSAEEGAQAGAAHGAVGKARRRANWWCSTRPNSAEPKTKLLASRLTKLGWSKALVIDAETPETNFARAARNLVGPRRAAVDRRQRLRHPAARDAGA